jgi:hypothetical protein
MKDLIKVELFKNIDSFVNEIDLTMDIKNIEKLKLYIEGIKSNSDDFDKFILYTHDHLQKYEVELSSILFSKKKINSSYYVFLNDVKLFDNLLDFNIFKDEVKNTKKDFVKYLYNIYMSTVFIKSTGEEASTELNAFINKIKDEANSLKESDIKQEKVKFNSERRNAIVEPEFDMSKLMSSMSGVGAGMGNGMDSLMTSILKNSDILNIATDISKNMQDQNMNPMTMLSSLMSGNITNSPLQGLVESIQEKIGDKIDSGQIDRNELESQAQSIMNSLGGVGMADLVKTMSEKMGNMDI